MRMMVMVRHCETANAACTFRRAEQQLEGILHLAQLGHHVYRIVLSNSLLDSRVVHHHKHVVLLCASVSHQHADAVRGIGGRRRETFSSPIVNLPWVSLLASQYCSRLRIGSVSSTLRANRALLLVYS